MGDSSATSRFPAGTAAFAVCAVLSACNGRADGPAGAPGSDAGGDGPVTADTPSSDSPPSPEVDAATARDLADGSGAAAFDAGSQDQDTSDPAADSDVAASDAGDTQCPPRGPEWGGGEGLMLPGADCLDCHRAGQTAERSPFTIAGTLFVSDSCAVPVAGAEIWISGADGDDLRLPTNSVGNFWTDLPVRYPAVVSVELGEISIPMHALVTDGACNRCHRPGERGPISLTP